MRANTKLGESRRGLGVVCAVTMVLLGSGGAARVWGGSSDPGKLSVGITATELMGEGMRVGDIRPSLRGSFGSGLEVSYTLRPWLDLVMSGYRGQSHFDFHTGFDRGQGRDREWGIEVGPNLLVVDSERARCYLGGVALYGEAQSKTTVSNPTWVPTDVVVEGPRTFRVGGAGRIVGVVRLLPRIEGLVQLSAGVMRARGHGSPSGVEYEWNGAVFSASMGIRADILKGRDGKIRSKDSYGHAPRSVKDTEH